MVKVHYKKVNELYREIPFTKYINTNELPLLIIKGKITKEEGYITELSRDTYTVTGKLFEEVAKSILSKNIPIFDDLIQNINKSKKSIIEKLSDINKLQKTNYLTLNSFTFNNKGIRLWEKSSEVRTIYVNEISDDLFLSLLDGENIFDRKSIQSKRSSIADLIKYNEPLVISKKFYERFILNASSSANGFRIETLKALLKAIDIDQVNEFQMAQELWEYINQNTALIEKKINKFQKNNLVFLNEEGRGIIDRTIQKYDANLLIVKSKCIRNYPAEILTFLKK